MNIKFGTDNFYVRYLKRFLNNELKQSKALLGAFDKTDLQLLINYLNMPNVKSMFDVYEEIVEVFPELNEYFNIHMQNNEIIFTARELSTTASEFISDNINKLKDYCKSVGWKLGSINEWIDLSKDLNNDEIINSEDIKILNNIIVGNKSDYDEATLKKADINLDGVTDQKDLEELSDYVTNNKISFEIEQLDRRNFFPNKDMLVFVNQFTGTFLYNYAIRDILGTEPDDIPHPNTIDNLKIALYECVPGQKITIAHNNSNPVHLIIGSSSAYLKQDLSKFMLNNVQEIDLRSGEGFEYTCASVENGLGYNAHWVCIQCPSDFGNLTGEKTVTELIELGDINGDGQVNLQDYHLLAAYTSTGPGSEQYHWEANNRQLVAMDLNKDGKVDMKDTAIFEAYLQGKIVDLGLANYTYTIPSDYDNMNNVSNFLIIDGHYDKTVNIPFNEFVQDDWVIHEKFFNYLLGMAIHKYSESTDITYLQELLKLAYPEYTHEEDFFYPGRYDDNMQKVLLDYQKTKSHFFEGDFNLDNKLTKEDLSIFRKYLDDPKHKEWEADPNNPDLEDSDVLSPEQKARADVNKDGYINEDDYILLEKAVYENPDFLRIYDVTFSLGWLDVQTEDLLEKDENSYGYISEVSK